MLCCCAPRPPARMPHRRRISCSRVPTISNRVAAADRPARHRRRADRLQLEVPRSRPRTNTTSPRSKSDLAFLEARHRKLFIQIQDRFFEVAAPQRARLSSRRPIYRGGLAPQADNPGENQPEGHGWVAMQWNPTCARVFRNCCRRSRRKFDGRVFGINLPETSADVDQLPRNDADGFTCDGIFRGRAREPRASRARHSRNHTWCSTRTSGPASGKTTASTCRVSSNSRRGTRHRLGRPGHRAVARQAQMKNSYPFFNQLQGEIEPGGDGGAGTHAHVHQSRKRNRSSRAKNSWTFAENYLGVDVIFWSTRSPWLARPR